VMKKEPNRFRTLYLASKAASSAGDANRARRYSKQLVEMCGKGDAADRPELVEMKKMGQ
ncbi:MAG: hypothetical protein H0W53_21340, partial [Acidobacteria bacterium]|nr:hypothetical protein [Acidobacteriota bacterium]